MSWSFIKNAIKNNECNACIIRFFDDFQENDLKVAY